MRQSNIIDESPLTLPLTSDRDAARARVCVIEEDIIFNIDYTDTIHTISSSSLRFFPSEGCDMR